jgi:hypothetical protein
VADQQSVILNQVKMVLHWMAVIYLGSKSVSKLVNLAFGQ